MVHCQRFQQILLISGCSVCLIFFGLIQSVLASEVWFTSEKESISGFFQKNDDTYTILYYPEQDGMVTSYSGSGYKAQDGALSLGFAHQTISQIQYNMPMAEFFYYLLNKSVLPEPYSDLDFSLLTYDRDNLLLDYTFSRGAWELVAGGKLILGQNYYLLAIQDGTAVNSPEELYNFAGYYDLYQGYAEAVGHGASGYFMLTYRPSAHWQFSLKGDDLAGALLWRGITHYDGQVGLNFQKKDDNGFTYITAPLWGKYYTDQEIRMKLTPTWRGTVHYRTASWDWENWLQYRETLELGTRGTLFFGSWPGLACGIQRLNNQWLGSLGLVWPNLQLELAANATNLESLSGLFLQVQLHLF